MTPPFGGDITHIENASTQWLTEIAAHCRKVDPRRSGVRIFHRAVELGLAAQNELDQRKKEAQ